MIKVSKPAPAKLLQLTIDDFYATVVVAFGETAFIAMAHKGVTCEASADDLLLTDSPHHTLLLDPIPPLLWFN